MARRLTGCQTSGGKGKRSRPISLYSETSMIPKGLFRIMGIPVAEGQLEQFKNAGIGEVYIITQYLENREHLSSRFSDGIHRFGLRIRYSDPRDDLTNNGSGDAVLTNIERKGLDGDTILLPNDNIFEFDLEKLVQAHRENKSVVSILTISMSPISTIGTYGLVIADAQHRVIRLDEKPKDDKQLMALLGAADLRELNGMRVPVNTAGYIIDNDALVEIAKERRVVNGRKKSSGEFDMAGNLIVGLIANSHPVHMIPVDAWGDFGSITFLLDTFPDVLGGKFPYLFRILETRGYFNDRSNNVWIHPDSLERAYNGKTLKERYEKGIVKIGPNVFIGREVVIEDGATVRYSDVEKYTKIGEGAELDRVYVSPYCEIGPYACLRECALGLQVRIESSKKNQTQIDGRSVIGPEILVPKGSRLEYVTVYPGYQFGKEGEVHSHELLEANIDQAIRRLNEYRAGQFTDDGLVTYLKERGKI